MLRLDTQSMTAWLTAAIRQQTDESEKPGNSVKASNLDRSTVHMYLESKTRHEKLAYSEPCSECG